MRVDGPSQSILATGSFTGLHPLGKLGHGYLTAEKTRSQPFCGNKEGWGPFSPHRYDVTPCFMDVWVSAVAVFGILFGAVAVWWLVKRNTRSEVPRDWHFWTKQVQFMQHGGVKRANMALAGTHNSNRIVICGSACLPDS